MNSLLHRDLSGPHSYTVHARTISLLAFNLGVEAGQLTFIAALLLLGATVKRSDTRFLAPVQVSAQWFMGVCGSFWLVERVTGFFF